MNTDPLPFLRDILLRRELNAEEERRLADWLGHHPEAVADWQAEVAVARGLRRLPPVPVPSNFTHRVLSQVQEGRTPAPASRLRRFGLRLPWRIGIPATSTALLVGLGVAMWHNHETEHQAEADRQLTAIRLIAELPPVVLQDFEAIQRFGESWPAVDDELLAALQ